MSREAQLRLGMIGAGAAARILYIPAMRREPSDWELVGIADASPRALAGLPSLSTDVHVTCGDFREFLAAAPGKLDGVAICLPHHLHEEAVCLALRAGLHVFCEKPLTLSTGSLERMATAAQAANRQLAVCQPRRRFPAVHAIQQLIQDRSLGACRRIVWNEGAPYGWPAESLAQILRETGGEMLFDIGAHAFDCLAWWLGDLEVASYQDDSAGGAAASYGIRLASPHCPDVRVRLSRLFQLENKVHLQFEKGDVTYTLGTDHALEIRSSWLPFSHAQLATLEPAGDFVDAIRGELNDFAALVRGEPSRSVTVDQARRVTRVFDRCQRLREPWCGREEERPAPRPSPPRGGVAGREAASMAVTGAGGFIGARLVERAIESGYDQILALTHRPQSSVRVARTAARLRLAALQDTAGLTEAFQGCRAVVHCAYGTADKETIQRTVVEGTRNVLEAARAAQVEVVVILGSMLAYGNPPATGIVDEEGRRGEEPSPRPSPASGRGRRMGEAPASGSGLGDAAARGRGSSNGAGVLPHPAPADTYGLAKSTMARESLAFAAKGGPRVVILEPTCVFGPFGRDFGTTYLDQMRRGEFRLLESGRGCANLIYVDNLVDAILLAAQDAHVAGRFLLNEDEYVGTWRDYFEPLWRIWSDEDMSSMTRDEIIRRRAERRRQSRPWNLLRAAVRAHRPAREWVGSSPAFQLWKRLRGSGASPAQTGNGAALADRPVPSTARPTGPREFAPDETFVALFDSQAIYSSTRFRSLTGWSPRINRSEALRATASWARAYLNSQNADFDPVQLLVDERADALPRIGTVDRT